MKKTLLACVGATLLSVGTAMGVRKGLQKLAQRKNEKLESQNEEESL